MRGKNCKALWIKALYKCSPFTIYLEGLVLEPCLDSVSGACGNTQPPESAGAGEQLTVALNLTVQPAWFQWVENRTMRQLSADLNRSVHNNIRH